MGQNNFYLRIENAIYELNSLSKPTEAFLKVKLGIFWTQLMMWRWRKIRPLKWWVYNKFYEKKILQHKAVFNFFKTDGFKLCKTVKLNDIKRRSYRNSHWKDISTLSQEIALCTSLCSKVIRKWCKELSIELKSQFCIIYHNNHVWVSRDFCVVRSLWRRDRPFYWQQVIISHNQLAFELWLICQTL